MTRLQFFLSLAVPILGALQRFAFSYGFRGRSRRAALGEALRIGALLQMIVAALVVGSMLAHGFGL